MHRNSVIYWNCKAQENLLKIKWHHFLCDCQNSLYTHKVSKTSRQWNEFKFVINLVINDISKHWLQHLELSLHKFFQQVFIVFKRFKQNYFVVWTVCNNVVFSSTCMYFFLLFTAWSESACQYIYLFE